MCLAIDIPFDQVDGFEISGVDPDIQISGTGISLWEIKQRAYFFGQQITAERLEIRNAMLSAAQYVHGKMEKGKEDAFEKEQLSVAYHHDRPLSRYAKMRREYHKNQKNGDADVSTTGKT